MKNNRNAIRVLEIISLLLIYLFFQLKINNVNNSLLETIIINLVTGCFVSIVMAYIDYRDKLDQNVKYFLKEVQTYYISLIRLEKYINNIKNNDELLRAIKSELSMIIDNAKKKQESIDFDFIMPTFKNICFQKSINDIYEVTFGIDLCAFDIYAKYNKKNIQEKSKQLQTIKLFQELINVEKKAVNEGMASIKKFEINKYWNYYLNKLVKQIQ